MLPRGGTPFPSLLWHMPSAPDERLMGYAIPYLRVR